MILALCRWITGIFFREIVVTGVENLEPGKNYIFTANHPNSLLDPLLLQQFNPDYRIRFVAKAPLFQVPVFGQILRRLGAIPVVRRFEADGSVDYTKFFEACVSAIKAGDSVAIFPEGRSLAQPFLAPMKTGPARLFFMAKEAGHPIALLPIGLNYERGAIFRSSVLIAIGAPVAAKDTDEEYLTNQSSAVRNLTQKLRTALSNLLFQADNYRDRELLLLLERLMAGHAFDSWSERLQRLKQFEAALSQYRKSNPAEIERIRHLLARYGRLASRFGLETARAKKPAPGFFMRLSASFGLIFAALGLFLNWLPYRLVGVFVKWKGSDESEAATFKVLYSLAVFPLFYAAEAIAIARFAGGIPCLIFCLCILPLSYFTLRYFEWRADEFGASGHFSRWFGGQVTAKVERQLRHLESRILEEVERLA